MQLWQNLNGGRGVCCGPPCRLHSDSTTTVCAVKCATCEPMQLAILLRCIKSTHTLEGHLQRLRWSLFTMTIITKRTPT
jgi:hypothetical protein